MSDTYETYRPTKFDSAADEVIAQLADEVEGYGRETFGETDAPCGFVQVVTLDETHDLDFADTTCNYPIGDLVGETARTYGVTADEVSGHHVVVTNSQGFVTVHTFDTAWRRDLLVEELREQWDSYCDEDDDIEDDPAYI